MKWIIFFCFVLVSFTALATDSEYKERAKRDKKLNFRSLASVTVDIQKETALRVEETRLRANEERFLNEKENWEKTLDYMETHSFE